MIRDLIPTLILREMKKLNAYRKFRSLQPYVEPIMKMKRAYSGRVLLLGSGLSVNDVDLDKIRDIDIIFMNNWHTHIKYDKLIENNNNCFHITPPIHGPASRSYWEDWLKQIVVKNNVNYILGVDDYVDSAQKILNGFQLNIFYYAPLLDRRIDRFSVKEKNYELENPIFGAGAVSVYALLLACYLGYNDIYLLGVDHSHIKNLDSASKGRFYDSSVHTDLEPKYGVEKIFVNQGNTFLQYRFIKNHYGRKNFFNLGGDKSIIDTFERKNFDDVFN